MSSATLTRVISRSSSVMRRRARSMPADSGRLPTTALARLGTDSGVRWIVSTDARRWSFLRIPPGCSGDLAGAITAVGALPRGWSTATGFEIDVSRLVAPAWRPGKVVGIAGNYRRHAIEAGLGASDDLRLFAKFPSAITGPNDVISVRSSATSELDYEVELAVVIGRRIRVGANVNPSTAVFGYAVANDVSARDIQRTGQLTYAKSLDSFLPIGPWITVDAAALATLGSRAIRTTVNGEVCQDSRLDEMVRDVPTIIRDVTRTISLDVGDIILTGSPAGSGVGAIPPRFLRDGDVVVCSIEGLGRLVNRVDINHR